MMNQDEEFKQQIQANDAGEARAELLKECYALRAENERLRRALMLMLDCVDYTKGSCGLTEMVGGALPSKIISIAREALEVKDDNVPQNKMARS